MTNENLTRPALFALLLFILAIACWEIYLRKDGADNAYDDTPALWAHTRGQVYHPKDSSTIFIGSSRIKFDLDIPTWKSLTGDMPVQLACVGSTPLPVLYDLAKDPKFKGKLVIDVTEVLFFSLSPGNSRRPEEGLKYYHDISPAQRASFMINKPMEASFVFLDKENYSLNAMLDKIKLKSRPGVFMAPIFPRDFDRTRYTRQSGMRPAFVADTVQQNKQKSIWKFFASLREGPPVSGAQLDSIIATVKTAIDQIKARGGDVVFVRTPSSDFFWAGEQRGFPREQYWDKLLATTGCQGIHFMDNPETNHYVCPEASHLSPSDAIDYTRILARTLQNEIHWKFPKSI
jgi:hypothetical protein